ncbi:hypothetical protein MCERE19_03273 [Spirosomataceae bacterium]
MPFLKFRMEFSKNLNQITFNQVKIEPAQRF